MQMALTLLVVLIPDAEYILHLVPPISLSCIKTAHMSAERSKQKVRGQCVVCQRSMCQRPV